MPYCDQVILNSKVQKDIWYNKYKHEGEELPSESFMRIAKGLSSTHWEKYYELMCNLKALPAGRILEGVGHSGNVTLLNCFVIPINDDSLESIFEFCKEAASTYKRGGGVGTDISCLRPNGEVVNNSAKYSTGAVSFIDLFSNITKTVGQSSRRGALMVSLDIQHPDILEFIKLKDDENKSIATGANLSVKVRDSFMIAVDEDRDFELWYPVKIEAPKHDVIKNVSSIYECYDYPEYEFFVINETEFRQKKVYKTIKARTIWDEVIKRTHAAAEPGIIFIDTVKNDHSIESQEPIITSNPCGEIMLQGYGACNLGAMNLYSYVNNKFTPKAEFDFDQFEIDIRTMVRLLDDVVTYTTDKMPLEQQRVQLEKYRKLGLGIMGLADCLAALGVAYDSGSALNIVEHIASIFEYASYSASHELAKERGSYPGIDTESIEGHIYNIINKGIIPLEDYKKYGIRNATLNTIAPTGTIGTMVGCSTGVEPIFALEYTRKSESLNTEWKVYHSAYGDYLNLSPNNKFPDFFKTAYDINPEAKVTLQATLQEYIDNSISVTTNLPKDTGVDTIAKIYRLAWEEGCKGQTVYREGSRSQVLISSNGDRDGILEGKTLVVPYKEKVYITLNFHPLTGKPVELFINSGKSGADSKAINEAFGRLTSLFLKQGGEIEDVIKTMIDIHGEETTFKEGWILHSTPDAVAKGLQKLMNASISVKCPECGGEIKMESGCMGCKSCGYSKCG